MSGEKNAAFPFHFFASFSFDVDADDEVDEALLPGGSGVHVYHPKRQPI